MPRFGASSSNFNIMPKQIFINLAVKDLKNQQTSTPIANTKISIAGLFSLSLGSVDEVNRIMANGLAAGGNESNEMRDYGFMQQRTYPFEASSQTSPIHNQLFKELYLDVNFIETAGI